MTVKRKNMVAREHIELGERIRVRRKELGLSQGQLADRCAVKQAFISAVERASSGISPHVLAQVAIALETTVEELEGRQPPTPVVNLPERVLSVDETQLVQVYRKTKRQDRETIVRFVRSFVDAASEAIVTPIEEHRERKRPPPPESPARATLDLDDEETVLVRIPVRAAAGPPISSLRGADDVSVPKRLLADGELVGVLAIGDSMIDAGIRNRDVVLCRPVHQSFRYQAGEIVVARLYPEAALDDESIDPDSGELTIKRFGGTHKGVTSLLAENPECETIRAPRKLVKIEAVVRYRPDHEGGWVEVPSESVKGRS